MRLDSLGPQLRSTHFLHTLLALDDFIFRPRGSLTLPRAPLPLPQHRQEAPQIKVWPQHIQKHNLRIFMALPKHKIR